MPWTPADAMGHTKKANTASKKRQWRDVANAILKKTGDEGRAVREANAAVERNKG
ncbi:MAG: hypothetical protein LUO93_05795 [Methanomicrobiales archaeon]|nr:hypothetical protein [Methanomicrobiales archaeon]